MEGCVVLCFVCQKRGGKEGILKWGCVSVFVVILIEADREVQ